MKTVAQLLKHDFSKGDLFLYDAGGNKIYYETSDGYWSKHDYDSNGKEIYFEQSNGYWYKHVYDSNGNKIYTEYSDRTWYKLKYDSNGNKTYYEDSTGIIIDKRPKKETCKGKVVEIDGKKYKLTEV